MTVVLGFARHAQYRFQSKLLIHERQDLSTITKKQKREHLGFKDTQSEKKIMPLGRTLQMYFMQMHLILLHLICNILKLI